MRGRGSEATAGFSTIEVLLAIAIITVGLTAVSYLMAVGMGVSVDSRETNLAYQAANEQIERLRRTPFASIPICTGVSFSVPLLSQLPNAQGVMSVQAYQGQSDLKLVSVRVSWTRRGPGRDQSVRLTTLIARRGLNEKWL
ncbi:MAG: type IV pilus modification PilV family protein [Armatimonadota bacterium]